MQDFNKYDYTLSIDDIIKVVDAGVEVLVIINGEYYEVKKGEKQNEKS